MPLRARPAFTLVELIVAVLLIDVALLAMIAGSAVIIQRQAEVRTRIAASQAAANRLQLLAAGPCITTTGTANGERGLIETWTAESRANGIRSIRDSVAYTANGVERLVVLQTSLPC
jgi:Tfp pilus assembly protein PilV